MTLEELLKDEAFVKAAEAAEDVTALAALFRSKGLDVTEEELKAAMDAPEGELNENTLEDVAGGCWNPLIRRIVKALRRWSSRRYEDGGGGSW